MATPPSAARLAGVAYLPNLSDGVLQIVVDPSKPDAMTHVLLMPRDECDDPIPLEKLASWCRPGLN
jgi:hypothetical protein